MKFTVKGVAYEMLQPDTMRPADAEAMEDALGVSMNVVMRRMTACVCDHKDAAHRVKKESGGPVGSCRLCDCDEFSSAAPTKYSNVMLWVSMRRDNPGLSFEEWGQTLSYDEIKYEPDAVDPTGEPTA